MCHYSNQLEHQSAWHEPTVTGNYYTQPAPLSPEGMTPACTEKKGQLVDHLDAVNPSGFSSLPILQHLWHLRYNINSSHFVTVITTGYLNPVDNIQTLRDREY